MSNIKKDGKCQVNRETKKVDGEILFLTSIFYKEYVDLEKFTEEVLILSAKKEKIESDYLLNN